jgi:hypothetical protein
MAGFTDTAPDLETYWRSIILFGRNVASYKFALAKSLIELGGREQELIRLEDLAEPFARHVCEHLKINPKQSTSASSKFLDACRAFNTDEISKADLIAQTTKLGFVNVIDAFHVVNQGEIPKRFFLDERKQNAGILGLSDGHDRLTAIAGHILAHKLTQITNRDVQRGGRTMRGLKEHEVRPLMEQLAALGWLDRIDPPRPSSPPHWKVNPAVHEKFAERALREAERRSKAREAINNLRRPAA